MGRIEHALIVQIRLAGIVVDALLDLLGNPAQARALGRWPSAAV